MKPKKLFSFETLLVCVFAIEVLVFSKTGSNFATRGNMFEVLRLSTEIAPEEVHHHDIVHFALDEVEREIDEGQENAVIQRLRDHLHDIETHRSTAQLPPGKPQP